MDIEYIRNMNPNNFFEVYQTSYQYLNEIAKAHNLGSYFMDNFGNLNRNPEIISHFMYQGIFNSNFSSSEKQRIINVLENYNRLTKNNLIFATSFTYLSNNSIKYFEEDYKQFRLKLETAGNIPQLVSTLAKMNTDSNGQREFFGVTYAQYAKIEYWLGEYSLAGLYLMEMVKIFLFLEVFLQEVLMIIEVGRLIHLDQEKALLY